MQKVTYSLEQWPATHRYPDFKFDLGLSLAPNGSVALLL